MHVLFFLTHLDILHHVLVKVAITFVNGICNGTVRGGNDKLLNIETHVNVVYYT